MKKYFIWIVIASVLANGLIYALVMPYFNAVDESAHFAYIMFINDQGRLPLLTDYADSKIINLSWHIDGSIFKPDPAYSGLSGMQYEAFQPPLYYLLALPFYKLAGANLVHKIFLLRFFGTLQLLILVFIVYKTFENLSNFFAHKKHLVALASFVIIGFTPAIVVRSVTIGNSILPIIFVSLIFWWMSKFVANSEKRASKKDAVVLGIFTSLAILSRFAVLSIIPLIFLFFLIKRRRFVVNSLIYFFVTVLIISPWFYFNMKHYGTPTANKQATVQQANFGFGNPGNKDIDLKYIQSSFPTFMKQIWVPEETNKKFLPHWNLNFFQLARYLNFLWIIGAAAMLVVSVNYIRRKRDYKPFLFFLILSAGVVGGVLQIVAASFYGNWHAMLGRHIHLVIILIAIFFGYLFFLISGIKNRIVSLAIGIVLILIPLSLNAQYLYHLNHSNLEATEEFRKKDLKLEYLNTEIGDNPMPTNLSVAMIKPIAPNQESDEVQPATSEYMRWMIETDNLTGLSYNSQENEIIKFYYLFEGDNDFSEENSDTLNSSPASLNISELEKIFNKRLVSLKIDPIGAMQGFDRANVRLFK